MRAAPATQLNTKPWATFVGVDSYPRSFAPIPRISAENIDHRQLREHRQTKGSDGMWNDDVNAANERG